MRVDSGWVVFLTKRADLELKRRERDEARVRFGLDGDAFSPSASYVPTGSLGELSEEQMEEAIEMAGLGAFERAIARVLGVDENVFTTALAKGKKGQSPAYNEFARRFYAARKQHMKRNLATINAAVEDGDWKPAAWQLERSFGFVKQETVEHDVNPNVLSLISLAQIPLEDAERVLIENEGVEVEPPPDDAA